MTITSKFYGFISCIHRLELILCSYLNDDNDFNNDPSLLEMTLTRNEVNKKFISINQIDPLYLV